MKTTYFTILFVAIITLMSCSSDLKKKKPTDVEKAVDVKKEVIVKKKVIEQPFVYGIDISSYQGDEVDLINKNKDSLSFVICKATGGITYTDPDFKANWNMIPKDGFIRGAYHFFYSKDNPVKQADNFIHAISDIKSTDLPPIIDFESGGMDASQTIEEVQSNFIILLQAIEKKLNRKPMIYTDIPVADKYLNDARFVEYALWIANYNGKSTPDLPQTWKTKSWTLWQRNANYKLDNFTNDSDVFNGDISQLKEFISKY